MWPLQKSVLHGGSALGEHSESCQFFERLAHNRRGIILLYSVEAVTCYPRVKGQEIDPASQGEKQQRVSGIFCLSYACCSEIWVKS